MNYYAVLDTNVIVSAMLKGSSIPGIIVDKAIDGNIIPVLSSEIIAEYKDVLKRKKFSFPENDVDILIKQLSLRAIFLDRTKTDEIFADSDDAVFYEVTMTAREMSDTFLITGNQKHFPLKTFVVTPREMLDIIGE